MDTRAESSRRRRRRDLCLAVLAGCTSWLLVSISSWKMESQQDMCWTCVLAPFLVGLVMCALSVVVVRVHARQGGMQGERLSERESLRERARLAAEARKRFGSPGPEASNAAEDRAERSREPLGSEQLQRLLRECPHGNRNADEYAECSTDAVCSVCMEEPPNIRVGPCGHACLCSVCYSRVMERNKRCPVCRQRMTWYVSSSAFARESTFEGPIADLR